MFLIIYSLRKWQKTLVRMKLALFDPIFKYQYEHEIRLPVVAQKL